MSRPAVAPELSRKATSEARHCGGSPPDDGHRFYPYIRWNVMYCIYSGLDPKIIDLIWNQPSLAVKSNTAGLSLTHAEKAVKPSSVAFSKLGHVTLWMR